MTTVTRTMSSCAIPASRAVGVAIRAVVGAAAAALAGWRSSRPSHHGVIDDHTLRDVGIHRLDIA